MQLILHLSEHVAEGILLCRRIMVLRRWCLEKVLTVSIKMDESIQMKILTGS